MSFDNLIGYILSYHCVCKILLQYSSQFKRSGHFHFFRIRSSAKPRPKKMSVRNLLGQILSISMFTQKFIKIFPTVQEIGPFSLFRIWHSAKPQPMINVILQFPGLDVFNIKLSAKFYQNIPNGLRVKFLFFQNLNLGKTSTNPKCLLTISRATSCQYQCVCKISSRYSTQFKRQGHFHFFRIWNSAKPRRMKNDISQSLGLDLVNINVYAEVYQNIPLSSSDNANFTFPEFGARQSLNR